MHARIIFHVYDFPALFLSKEEHGFSCLLFFLYSTSLQYLLCNAQNVFRSCHITTVRRRTAVVWPFFVRYLCTDGLCYEKCLDEGWRSSLLLY